MAVMSWRRVLVVVASAALLSCALISGAADLTIGDPLAEAGMSELDGTADANAGDALVRPDLDGSSEAATDGEAGPARKLHDDHGMTVLVIAADREALMLLHGISRTSENSLRRGMAEALGLVRLVG